jgi:hypothetical protein
VLPQKRKSSAPGLLIGQRHLCSLNSSNEQQCALWIGSSAAAGCGSPYVALSI